MTVSGICGKHLTWTFTDGTLTISGTGKMDPCVINDRVLPPWNEYLDSIQSIEIRNGAASIADYAFCDCRNLLSVHLPDSVTEIGRSAFSGCKNLVCITIPAGITEIGVSAFGACSSLHDVYYAGTEAQWKAIKYDMDSNRALMQPEYIHFSDAVPSADAAAPAAPTASTAFGTCGKDLSWVLADGRLTISGTGPMNDDPSAPWTEYRHSIHSVEIRKGVTGIGNWAFSNCSFLTSVSIPNSVACIGIFAFSACTGLTEVHIPDSVTCIDLGAFAGCTGLTNVSIPGSVTRLYGHTFLGCTGLTGVSIPESITSIENGTFSRCSNLHDVYYAGTEEQWKAVKIDMHNEPLANAVIHFAKASL